MEFKKGTHVYSWDNWEIGCIKWVVINPMSKQVTHVVISQGPFIIADKVVPVAYFRKAAGDHIRLRFDIGDLNDLPTYDETEFVPIKSDQMAEFVDEADQEPFYLYWNPSVAGGSPLAYDWLMWNWIPTRQTATTE